MSCFIIMILMNTFRHYSSIENTNNTKALEYIRNKTSPELLWNATEKIHGSNFSATTDGNNIKWGKRSSFIGNDALHQFNNAHYIKEKYSQNIKDLFFDLQSQNSVINTIQIFGEICGGGYDGVTTTHPNSVKKVQKQIMYCPDIEFIVFDILIIGDYNRYMNMAQVSELCEKHNIPHSRILHVGTLSELIELSPIFVTTIPGLFGLPDLENNMSEGYVFKPNNEIITSGSRIIMKHKSPKFCERIDKKIHITIPSYATEQHHDIINKICMYVNENRINNVLSKLDDVEQMLSKKLIGLIVQDVVKDAIKDLDDVELEFYKKEKKIIMPQLMTHCSLCYDEYRTNNK